MKLELNKPELYKLISALETEAENDLKLIKKDCDFDIYSSEIYIESYLSEMALIKKINQALKEIKE